jgi:hypothetical protein
MRNRYQAYVTFSSRIAWNLENLWILAAVVSLMALILIVSYRISQPKDNHVAVS